MYIYVCMWVCICFYLIEACNQKHLVDHKWSKKHYYLVVPLMGLMCLS